MLQTPPAHKKTLEVFSLELPQAFPFESAEFAQVFSWLQKETGKKQP